MEKTCKARAQFQQNKIRRVILDMHCSSVPAVLHFQAFYTTHPVYSDEVWRVWKSYFGILSQTSGTLMWNTTPFMHWILCLLFSQILTTRTNISGVILCPDFSETFPFSGLYVVFWHTGQYCIHSCCGRLIWSPWSPVDNGVWCPPEGPHSLAPCTASIQSTLARSRKAPAAL